MATASEAHAMSVSKDMLISDADRRRALFASAVGSAIEWYDYFLYGTMAAIVFGNLSLRCQGRSPSGDHHEASVPMRSTGADQPVRAMKAGNAAGAKGLGQAVVVDVQLALSLIHI